MSQLHFSELYITLSMEQSPPLGKVNYVFRRALHRFLNRARLIQPHLCTVYLKLILVLFSCVHPGLPNDPFSSNFPSKILYTFLISLARYIPARLGLLDFIILQIFGEEC
jgi:hypothetical protein